MNHLFHRYFSTRITLTICFIWSTVMLAAALFTGCEHTTAVAPGTLPEGNCVGKICNENGTPVEGAAVLLVPEGYSPLNSDVKTVAIDSTTSDASGYFGFTVVGSGKYNLLADDTRHYVLKKAIPIKVSNRMEVPDQILREPGSLTGSVTIEPGNTPGTVIILLTGTNTYATPSETDGTFTVEALAAGSYDLRILSTQSDFAAVETTVTIISGEQTRLPPVTLQKKQLPHITSCTAVYDSHLMQVTLSWTTNDAAIIDSFTIYRNREHNIAPVSIVGVTTTSVTFDLIMLPTDTYIFQVAPVGIDGWEGEAATSNPVINRSVITLEEMPLQGNIISSSLLSINNLLFTKNGIYACSRDSLKKLNQDFSVERVVVLPGSISSRDQAFTCDTAEELCILVRPASEPSIHLVRYTSDLTLVSDKALYNNPSMKYYSMARSSTGAVLLYVNNYNYNWEPQEIDTTWILVFDPDLHLVSDTIHNDSRYIRDFAASGDTVTVVHSDNISKEDRIVYYDPSFTTIYKTTTMNEVNNVVPDAPQQATQVLICSPQVYLCMYSYEQEFLLSGPQDPLTIITFFNRDNRVVARYPYNGYLFIRNYLYSDHNSFLYYVTSGRDSSVLRFSLAPMLTLTNN